MPKRIRFLFVALLLFTFNLSPFTNQAQQFEEIQKLLASDGSSGDEFSYSVYISGDYAIVGAPSNGYGSAYIYFNNSGTWEQQTKLTASDAEAGDKFGISVSMTEDYAVVGASGVFYDKGAVYIFQNNSGTWEQIKKLSINNGSMGDRFGYATSISGDNIVIGAYGYYNFEGMVYIYSNSTGTWLQEDYVWISNGPGDSFGCSVSIFGDYFIAGERGCAGCHGAAYIYHDNNGNWENIAELHPSNGGQSDDEFGRSVSIYGDYAIVGSFGMYSFKGAAYVYKNNSGAWQQIAELTASNATYGDYFGNSVSIAEDYAIVGAYGRWDESGSAYMFRRSYGAWLQHQILIPDDNSYEDQFGRAVSISDETVLAGALRDDDNGFNSGAAYIYGLSTTNVKNNQQNNISILPNPTTGKLVFEFERNDIQNIKVSDLIGKTIFEKSEILPNETIDLSEFETGVYIVSIQTDKEVLTTKIVKE